MDELKRQNPPSDEQPMRWDDVPTEAIAVGIEDGIPVYDENGAKPKQPTPFIPNVPVVGKGAAPVRHFGPNRKQRRAIAKRGVETPKKPKKKAPKVEAVDCTGRPVSPDMVEVTAVKS